MTHSARATSPHKPIVIVGAGIAGLTTAIALRQHQIPTLVLEQANEIEEVGAGLQLQPNATRVLRALGIDEELHSCSVEHAGSVLKEAGSGRTIVELPPSKNRFEYPHYLTHRADLQKILQQHAEALGATIITGQRVKTITQLDGSVAITTKQGDSHQATAVIGADGIKSIVRQQCIDKTKPRFTGQVCYRGLVPSKNIAGVTSVTGIAGPKRHFVFYPVRNGELINFVAQVETDHWTKQSWSTAADPKELKNLYQGWDDQVTQVLNHVSDVYKWALYSYPSMATWSNKNVVLIGDAAHPTLPNLAAGAGMAIEDGYILAQLLSQQLPLEEQNLSPVFERFYQLRSTRCQKIQQRSEAMANFFHIRHPIEQALKYGAARLGSKLAPSATAKRMTWTYDYDACKVC